MDTGDNRQLACCKYANGAFRHISLGRRHCLCMHIRASAQPDTVYSITCRRAWHRWMACCQSLVLAVQNENNGKSYLKFLAYFEAQFRCHQDWLRYRNAVNLKCLLIACCFIHKIFNRFVLRAPIAATAAKSLHPGCLSTMLLLLSSQLHQKFPFSTFNKNICGEITLQRFK